MSKKEISRRDFIKGSAALGLAAVGASFGLAGCSKKSSGTYVPGTYSASAYGMKSDVTVTIEVDEEKILKATVDAAGETAEIGGVAAEDLAKAILDKQTFEVDAVSGATKTSDAVKKACEEAIAKAKGVDVDLVKENKETAETDWLGQEPEVKDSDITETIDCDVVVIGAGHAGSFAATTAAEQGLNTILIEKFAHDMASGIRDTLCAVNSKDQLADGVNPTVNETMKYIIDWSQGYADRKLVKTVLENSGETMDWYTERMAEGGMVFRHEIDTEIEEDQYKGLNVGHSIQYEMEPQYYEQLTMDTLFKYALDKGLRIDYETTMVKLVHENDKVTGIIATNKDGKYVKYNTTKGVIVATGGYSANDDMMKALQPQSLEQCCINYSKSGSKGDGIKACLWAGAAMDSTHTSMIFDRGAIKPDQAGKTEDGQLFWMGTQPFLKVNLEGKRFMSESMPYDYTLHAASDQPSHTYCNVWDSDYVSYIEKFRTHGCSRIFAHDNGAYPVFPIEVIQGMNADLMDKGYIVQADTIEELAEKLNINKENFVATVNRYNELADLGVDEDFGKESYRLSKMQTAPFFGVRQAGGYLICTMDGIKINENMNALKEDGTVIEGLYVIGDCSGNYFHGSYPNLLAGCAAGRSATQGRIVGKLLAK